MRKKIVKFFWAWNFEKEEKWLNEMASKGLVLNSMNFGSYLFEDCLPGEYTVRLELMENVPSHPESQQYIQFLEDTGAEYLGSLFRWSYFRMKTEKGEFNLYSDNTSRIKQLNQIYWLVGVGVIVNFLIAAYIIGILMRDNVGEYSYIALFNVVVGLILALGCFSIYRKKRKLVKARKLFE